METIKSVLFDKETQVQTLIGSMIVAVWLSIAAIVFFFVMGVVFIVI